MTTTEAPTFGALYTFVTARRSIRRYDGRPVPRAALEQVLTAAIWAPSAHNRQPWRFAAITTPAVRESLAQAMGERLRVDLAADGLTPQAIEQDAGRSYARISNAPALILVCLSMSDMDHYADPKRAEAEYLMAVQSTAMAVQNLLLAAHALELGTCWMCAPLFCPDVVQRILDLPDDWQPQALITLGYPVERKEKTREPLETRALWR